MLQRKKRRRGSHRWGSAAGGTWSVRRCCFVNPMPGLALTASFFDGGGALRAPLGVVAIQGPGHDARPSRPACIGTKETLLKNMNKPLLAGFLLALTMPFAAN